jgi:flagellin
VDDKASSEGLNIQIGANFRGPDSDADALAASESVKISTEAVGVVQESLSALKELMITGENGSELGGDTGAVFQTLDTAMREITDFRATLGATQSRMNSAITGIDVTVENMASAQARIRDVDYASETAKLTQNRILTAAGTAVLTQANALPETVLQLLRA